MTQELTLDTGCWIGNRRRVRSRKPVPVTCPRARLQIISNALTRRNREQ
jgi:hypothetical protein